MNTRDNTDAEAILGAGQVAAPARGLKILQCFASGHPELSLRELTELTGLAKLTATRLINTLCDFHLLRYSSRTSRYVLGTEAIALSAPAPARMTIRHIARAPMQALARYCAGQVALLTGDGSSLIYTEIAQADESPMHWIEPGTRLPLHSSAPGYARLLTVSREDSERDLRHVRLVKPASVDHLMHRLSDAGRELDEFGFCMC